MFNALLIGCTISLFSYGAVFIMLINIALKYGFKKALLFETGHLLSILFVMVLVNFGFIKFIHLNLIEKFLNLLGGVFLIVFGIFTYIKSVEYKMIEKSNVQTNLQYITQGFVINILNPTNLIIWIGIFGSTSLINHYTQFDNFIFGLLTLIGIAFIDLAKVIVVTRIGKNLVTRNYKFINILRTG